MELTGVAVRPGVLSFTIALRYRLADYCRPVEVERMNSPVRGGPKQHGSSKHRHLVLSIVFSFVLGFVIEAVIIWVELQIEPSDVAMLLEQFSSSLQQAQLAYTFNGKPNVVVVDVSGLAPEGEKTDRRRLTDVVRKIAAANPAAIGIDILFSVDSNGMLSEDDADFLAFCSNLRRKSGERIPVRVALANDFVKSDPSSWLETYSDLGAAAMIPVEAGVVDSMDTRLTFSRIAQPYPILSLSYALSRDDQTPSSDGFRRLGLFMHDLFPTLVLARNKYEHPDLQAENFKVDFGPLEDLKRSKLPADATFSQGVFTGQVVLVGHADVETAPQDRFYIPSHKEPVAGIYVHAAALETLLSRPLYTLSRKGQFLGDLIGGGVPLILIFAYNLYSPARGHRRLHERNTLLSRWVQVGMMIVVLFLGWVGVNFTGILWTDFLLVLIAILLHRPIESFLERNLMHIPRFWRN